MVARLLDGQLRAMTRCKDYDVIARFIIQNAPVSLEEIKARFPGYIYFPIHTFLTENPRYFLWNKTISIQEDAA